MSKYVVTNNSYYQPFSYQELVAPLQQMTDAQNAAQDNYDTLSMETEALREYISDNPEDRNARKMYDSYINKLQTLQNNLWENGFNAQTRRDLAAAKAGYASDITRLQKAIQSRQERSQEYWKTKHANPDMIMGADPGLSGLDAYLADDNYGRNFYTYSGNQFASEVATEAKARANEMLRDPEILKNPQIAGYITRITQDGFTNEEVDAASAAVQAVLNGDNSVIESLDPASAILADVLMSNLNATGARDNVSAEEFGRLFDYGRRGLSAAVGEKKLQDFQDKVWDAQQDWYWWKKKQDYTAGQKPTASNGGDDDKNGNGYDVHGVSSFLATPEGKEKLAQINKNFYDKFETPYNVTDANGNPDRIASPFDAQRILDGMGREDFINRYGVDPDRRKFLGAHGVEGRYDVVDGRGKVVKMNVGYSGKGKYRVSYKGEDGQWHVDKTQSEEFTKDFNAYRERVKEWKKNNKGVDIQNLVLKEDDWSKMQKEFNIPNDIPREVYPEITALIANVGERTPAYLADATKGMKDVRENYANFLISSYSSAAPDNKGRVAESSDAVVYKVSPDGSLTPERNLGEVLGKDEKTGELNNNVLGPISATPEDVINGMIDFTTTRGGEYRTKAKNFGNEVQAVYNEMQGNALYKVYNDGTYKVLDPHGAINYMMRPLLDPVAAWRMNDEEVSDWISYCEQNLGGMMDFGVRDENNNVVSLVTPRAIILDENYQNMLRSYVTEYINQALANSRDYLNNRKYKEVSDSTTKPYYYKTVTR